MKKILICGATGFIGRNIAEYYASQKEYEVYGTYYNSLPYSYDNINFIKADLTKAVDVENVMKGKDIVIQAAATTSGSNEIINKPYYHVTDNAVMNSLILRTAFENNIQKYIFFSCSVMYQPNIIPRKESDFNAADEIFPSYFGVGWTKVYLEKMCEFYSRISNTKFSVLRHSNIYGPWDKYDLEKSHVFGATITKVMKASDNGELEIWGEGKERRDLLYISDLITAVDLAINKQENQYELFNIGSGEAITIYDLVEKIIKVSGKNLSIKCDKSKPTIPTQLSLDCTKAKQLFGWEYKVGIEEGIKRTIEWYKENI